MFPTARIYTSLAVHDLGSVLLAQLTALRDEQPVLRDNCWLLLVNVSISLDFFFLLFFFLAFKTFLIIVSFSLL